MKKTLLFAAAFTAMSSLSHGVTLLATGGKGGRATFNDSFQIGTMGNTVGNNVWPLGEEAFRAVDGLTTGSKYLNYGGGNTGLIFSLGNGPGYYINQMVLWTANDAEDRDPASYRLYGSPVFLSGLNEGIAYNLNSMTLISFGSLSLPSARNTASAPINFTNTTEYASFVLYFPTLKNSDQGLMQIGEVQVSGQAAVPEPTTGILSLAAVGGLTLRRRRR